MKKLIFPSVVFLILVAGLLRGGSIGATPTVVTEEELVSSGRTVDAQCGEAVAEAAGGPVQVAVALGCPENSNGECMNPGATCGKSIVVPTKHHPSWGVCTTVVGQHERARCLCVRD